MTTDWYALADNEARAVCAALPPDLRAEIIALWDEYERAATPEAKLAKGLDKLETILQHNQGAMPVGFDFRFNLHYGAKYTSEEPVLRAIREILDVETEQRAREREGVVPAPSTPHAP